MFGKKAVLLIVGMYACATLSPKFHTTLRSNRVAYAMAGNGSVTVVFESGFGDGMDKWEPVFDSIATFATTFAYDRPGYGGSHDVSGARTGKDVVDALRLLLAQVELHPPYILVGHSLGGQYVELYARLYPDDVASVVLVDSRHPDFTKRCEEQVGARECGLPGLMKLIMPGHMQREFDGGPATIDQIQAAGPFPDIDLVILSRSEGRESKEWLALWADLQSEYARLTRRSRHIVSDHSGHYVHHDDPAIVIAEVRAVVMRVRDNASQ
jgi:pimeloyl-ACP methyl ester carboxylesterase